MNNAYLTIHCHPKYSNISNILILSRKMEREHSSYKERKFLDRQAFEKTIDLEDRL